MPTVVDSSDKVDTCTHAANTLPHGICKAFGELINTEDMAESSIKIHTVPISSNYSDFSLSFSTTCPASHSCSMAIVYKSHQTLYMLHIQAHWKVSVMTLHSSLQKIATLQQNFSQSWDLVLCHWIRRWKHADFISTGKLSSLWTFLWTTLNIKLSHNSKQNIYIKPTQKYLS